MLGYFTQRLDKEFDYFLLPDGYADVFIYDLDSVKEIEHEAMDGVTNIEYQYRMNEFHVDSKVVTQDMVIADPQKYIDYEPEKEKTLKEQVDELKQQNDDLIQCLLEMSEMVYQ